MGMSMKKVYGLLALGLSIAGGSLATDVQLSTSGGDVTWSHYDTYISEVQLTRGATSHYDGYDGALYISVDGSVNYSSELHFSATDAIAIQYVTIENPFGSDQTYTISCTGNLGSDGSTIWHYASSGGPYYTISSDQSSPSTDGGDPVISFLYGDSTANELGTQRSMPYSNNSDTHSFYIYNVTIPAGETHRYLFLGGAGDIDDSLYNRPSETRAAVLNLLDPANWPEDFTSFMTVEELIEVVNWDVGERLMVEPDEDFAVNVYVGEPIAPTSMVYMVTNRGSESIDFTVTADPDWISTSTQGGTLESGEALDLTISILTNAYDFSMGTHTGLVSIYNTTDGEEFFRNVEVGIHALPAPPTDPYDPLPADGASNVSAGTMLDWEHDSGIVLPSPLVNTTSTYTVYFGTNSSDMVPAATGLTNSIYDPGLLEVDTTYYWQVVASNEVGAATGAVWSFTTWINGPLDHFEWEIGTDHPRIGRPIDVSLYAKDMHSHTVLDYTGPVAASAFQIVTNTTVLVDDGFDSGNLNNWSLSSGIPVVTGDHAIDGPYCLYTPAEYLSLYRYFDNEGIEPDGIEFYMRAGNEETYTYVRYYDYNGNYLNYFYMSNGQMYLANGNAYVPYEPNRWYKITLMLDWENQQMDWYLDDELTDSVTFYSSATNISTLRIYSPGYSEVWYDGFRYFSSDLGSEPLPVTFSTNTDLTAGVWTGQATINEYKEQAYLHAQDGSGVEGDSDIFLVDYLGYLSLELPESVREGDGVLSGSGLVSVDVPPESDLTVSLAVSNALEITLPSSVVIPAGETNVAFDVTILDDGVLDGTQTSLVHAASLGYFGDEAFVSVSDNETATLSLTLPQTTYEGIGTVTGAIVVDRPPAADVYVNLVSDDESEISSGQVLIPAGQTYALVELDVVNDTMIDGVQQVGISAEVSGWTGSQSSLLVMDDETAAMEVYFYNNTYTEGAGTNNFSAYVFLSGATMVPIEVALVSSDPSRLEVPETVTINAGSQYSYFSFTVPENDVADGTAEVTVSAQVPGFLSGVYHLTILDNDPHHLNVTGVSGDIPFFGSAEVTVSAMTIDDQVLTEYGGDVTLSASGDGGEVALSPSTISLLSGTGSDYIRFETIRSNVELVADAGNGLTGTSAVFNVLGPVVSISPDALTNTPVVAGDTLMQPVVVSNAGNAALSYGVFREDEYIPGLILHYTFDEDIGNTVVDGSGYGHDGVRTNNCVYVDGVFGQGLRIEGNDQAYSAAGGHVLLPKIDFNAMNEVTVSLWVNEETMHYPDGEAYINFGTGPSDNGLLQIGNYYSSYYLFGLGEGEIQSAYASPTQNEFVHYAITYADGIQYAYRNGELIGQESVDLRISNPEYAALGRHWWNNGSDTSTRLTAVFDDVRVYNRCLSDQEIYALYGAAGDIGPSVPEAGIVAYYPLAGNAEDASENSHDGTVYGAVPVEDRFGNPDSAYQFNGASDYIDLGSIGGFKTLSMWIKPGPRSIYDFYFGHSNFKLYASVLGGGKLGLASDSGSVSTEVSMDSYQDQWVHLVAVSDGAGSKIFVNGTNVTTSVAALESVGAAVANLGRSSDATHYFNGAIDDVRLYDRVLTELEIGLLYNEVSPVLPPDLDEGLAAYYPFVGSASDASGNGNDGVAEGSAFTQDRFGNIDEAYDFGADSYVRTLASTGSVDITGPITLAAWINPEQFAPMGPDTGDLRTIMRKSAPDEPNGYGFAIHTNGQLVALAGTNRAYASGMDPLPIDAWSHVAAAYDGTNVLFYVDGALVGTAAYDQPLTSSAERLCLGRLSDSVARDAFYGGLDELRLYNRALTGDDIAALYEQDSVNPGEAAWLSFSPTGGTLLPGESADIYVTFDATMLPMGRAYSNQLVIVCNDPVSSSNNVMVSMWTVPGAPVMNPEPEFTEGTSNTVSWSPVAGDVVYQAEVLADVNSTPIADSGWIQATEHTFGGLVPDSFYVYHVRAAVQGAGGLMAGPWSGWVSSTQSAGVQDADEDGLPDWWETQYLGDTEIGGWNDDADADGQSNGAEFIAGMDPLNADSSFAVYTVEQPSDGVYVITWDAVTGRVYSVFWGASVTNAFETMETDIHYPQNSYTDEVHQAESSGFYRVGVELE